MIVLDVGASTLAHTVHYSVLGVGALGVVALLGPHLALRSPGSRPRDEHEHRIAQLRAQLGTGTLTAAPTAALHRRTGLLSLAVLSSGTAATVHATLGPEHFRERAVFGLFFAVAALAQMGWSVAVTVRPNTLLLQAGMVGNAATIALWTATRTVGLPGGLLPGPEPVGPWDLLCTVAELVVVAACVRLLQLRATTTDREGC